MRKGHIRRRHVVQSRQKAAFTNQRHKAFNLLVNGIRTGNDRFLGDIAAHAQTAAQPWPQKTVRFIIPLPPGSGMDLSARLIAERLTQSWGQSVVVENRQGADGIPAVTAFLSARDNHTVLFSFAGIVSFNHLLHERLPYDPKELVPLAPAIDNFLGVYRTFSLI